MEINMMDARTKGILGRVIVKNNQKFFDISRDHFLSFVFSSLRYLLETSLKLSNIAATKLSLTLGIAVLEADQAVTTYSTVLLYFNLL